MSRANGIGCKGGTSATAGRKSETIEADFCGKKYRKRVFFGQRWLVYVESEKYGHIVTAWHSKKEAEDHLLMVDGDHWPVQLVAEAVVV